MTLSFDLGAGTFLVCLVSALVALGLGAALMMAWLAFGISRRW